MAIPVLYTGWLGGQTAHVVTSPFGMRHTPNEEFHNGIDLRVAQGSPLYAPLAGTVALTGVKENTNGLYMYLDTTGTEGETYRFKFLHLHDVVVTSGFVQAGTLLAHTGGDPADIPNCGNSNGAHLHLQIEGNANSIVNPLDFLSAPTTLSNTGEMLSTGRTVALLQSAIRTKAAYMNTNIDAQVDTTATEQQEVKTPKKVVSGVGDRLAPGIWQITKLLMDSTAARRRLYDSSISVMDGALINYFNKVCQRPLVEFRGDTFGDQYYFMVVQPPYDYEGVHRMMNMASMTALTRNDIRSVNLGWNGDNIYSWYQLIPFVEAFMQQEITMYMPAVFFPEYAAVWGSRECVVQSQYAYYYGHSKVNAPQNQEVATNRDNVLLNCIKDLKYLIESNAYLPFTRRGTITINGDRRFKAGTLVSTPWGEYFFIDAVQQSYAVTASSVERSTVLTVSRGMFIDYIRKDNTRNEGISYFTLIDFGEADTLEGISKITWDTWPDIIGKWRVRSEVFDFFIQRKQWPGMDAGSTVKNSTL